jgi:hypothetical protein
MADKNNLSNLTDQELVTKIKENSDYLGIVYKRCKSNCLGFMRKITNAINARSIVINAIIKANVLYAMNSLK